MNKALATISALALATLACSQTVGTLADKPQTLATTTQIEIIASVQPAITPLETPTQKTIVIIGNWHLRKQPSPNGASVIIPDETTVSVIRSVGSWHEVNVTINGTKYSGWVHINSEGKQKSPVDD